MKILHNGKPCNISFWDFVELADLKSLPTPKRCELNEKLPPKPKKLRKKNEAPEGCLTIEEEYGELSPEDLLPDNKPSKPCEDLPF